VRVSGLIAAIALSAASCGGDVVSPPGHSTAPPEPSSGPASSPPQAQPATLPAITDGGPETDATVSPPAVVEDASVPVPVDFDASPPVDAAYGSDQPVVVGTGSVCPASTALFVGTKVTVSTAWPASAAVAKGSGPFFLWLLSIYEIDASNRINGKTATCGMQLPMITLSAIGDMAMGVPSGQMGLQQIVVPATSWKGVPPVGVTGLLGGWNVGSSVAIDPVVTLYGLKSTSALADGVMQWPASMSALASSDLTYADGTPYTPGTGLPGILANYDSTPPYYPATTSLAVNSPQADQIGMVLRTQLRLYGTSTSCTVQSGQASMNDLNVRVVGCELAAAGGGACTVDQTGFLDSNVTQLQPSTGTFTSQVLATGASCTDVLSALP
jgi:hypothetical protein